MLIDARSLPDGAKLYTDVCIVGGGIAGITLARTLERRGIASILLEAGGLKFSGRSHYEGEVSGLAYDLAASRTRQLGGSSNCWWGWCTPFSEMDFRKRSWVPNSGWPIASADLEPYYPAAAEMLQIDAFDGTGGQRHAAAVPAALTSGDLAAWISHLSPPTRFNDAYLAMLRASPLIKLFLNAPVVEILTSDPPTLARGVRIKADGQDRVVEARIVVLAAGGIENPRLMLASNAVEAAGVGNQHDTVGRYFMDHPRLRIGHVRLKEPERVRRLFDVRYYYGNRSLRERVAGSIGLSDALQERGQLLQCFSGLMASYIGEEAPGVDIAKTVYKAVMLPQSPPLAARSLLSVVSALPAASFAYAASLTRSTALVRHFEIQSALEPVPDRDNRVTLSERRDELGMSRPRLSWRIGEAEKRTHLAALNAIKSAIEGHGLGSVEIRGDDMGAEWETLVLPSNHHMGTTRMSENAREGVVDADCRVHGYGNLFVAGSSVFPTGAGQPPTFTIVALALRLADTVAASLRT
ncbi:GMC family oxidoreductase [Hyphomicrobium sp. CS1GBMeth3]|uniref:FAD-dependent oxidoreductase n=1 Tax=Hyphomicrobium sp. CS1GBMeth3 TaxID=1892845 RepID=UPI000930AF51|nr:GMC family oxidoreductase [Hyphomicrobium sp. CS1GBMeth3]